MKSKIIYGILAVLLALGLWLYVVTVVNPEWEETFYDIPVVLENEEILNERGLMLVSDEALKVNLRLSGSRTDMIKLNSANITLRADLSRIYSAGEQRLSYSITYPNSLASNTFELISQSPQEITLSVVERMSKPVDVVTVIGDADPGYIALTDEAEYEEQITIIGPAEVVNRIVTAEVTVDLTGEKETIKDREYDYVLKDAEGNVIENEWIKAPDTIQITLKIQHRQEASIAVDVLPDGTGLTAEDYEVTCYNQETGEVLTSPVVFSGSETQLAVLRSVGMLRDDQLFLDKKVVLAQMSGTALESGGEEIVLENINLDDMLAKYEITNRSPVSLIKVVVRIPERSIKELKITAFDKENLPAGLTETYQTPHVTVILRGPQWELDWITEENIQVIVDFTGAVAGESSKDFPAKIVVNTGSNTFAVGSYKVNAIVSAVSG